MSPIQWNLLQILHSMLEVIASLLTVSVDRVYNFTLTAWYACPLLLLTISLALIAMQTHWKGGAHYQDNS